MYCQILAVTSCRVTSSAPMNSLSAGETSYFRIRPSEFGTRGAFSAGAFLAAPVALRTAVLHPRRRATPAALNILARWEGILAVVEVCGGGCVVVTKGYSGHKRGTVTAWGDGAKGWLMEVLPAGSSQ